jgi:hypothetical protein
MQSLVVVIAVLIVAFMLQKSHPYLAAFVAVFPVKILAVIFMSLEQNNSEQLQSIVSGLVFWQFLWGGGLLILYFWLRH